MKRLSRLLRYLAGGITLALVAVVLAMGVTGLRHLVVSVVAVYGLTWLFLIIVLPDSLGEMRERFVLVSTALALSWLAFELVGFAGLLDYRRLLVPAANPFEASENVWHPEMRVVRRPYLSIEGEVSGNIAGAWRLKGTRYPYKLRYDQYGLRNNRSFQSADVVVLGDSYIESPLVAESDIMTTVLAGLLGQDVMNVGLAAWGPGEELAALREVGVPMRPRLVIWAFFEGNDPQDLLVYQDWIDQGRYGRGPRARWTLLRSAAVALGNMTKPVHKAALRQVASFRTTTGEEVPVYFGWPPPNDLDDGFFPAFRRVMEEAHAITRDLDARFVVMFVPRKFRVYRGSINIPRNSKLHQWRVGDLPEQIRALVESVSPEITFLDLTDALAEAAASGQMVYFPDDTHWTAEGNRVVAQAIVTALRTEDERE